MNPEEIIMKATDPKMIAEILTEQGRLVSTLMLKEPDKLSGLAAHLNFRTIKADGIKYNLCPVPFLCDDKRSIERGFAVDSLNNRVLSFMNNYETEELLIDSKLTHCVHTKITYNTEQYQKLKIESLENINYRSAILFIYDLLMDLTLINSEYCLECVPIEFFDKGVYQQLINNISSIKDERWRSSEVKNFRLKQLLGQIDDLNEKVVVDEPIYNTHLTRITGCVLDLINLSTTGVNKDLLKPYVQYLYKSLIKNKDYNRILRLKNFTGEKLRRDTIDIQETYKELLRNGELKFVEFLYNLSEIKPNVKEMFKEIQGIYKKEFSSGHFSLSSINSIKELTGIGPNFNELIEEIQLIYQDELTIESINYNVKSCTKYVKKIFEFTGVKPTDDIIQEWYKLLIGTRHVWKMKELSEYFDIPIKEEAAQEGYKLLFKNINDRYRNPYGAYAIMPDIEEIGIKPNKKNAQIAYKSLIKLCFDDFKKLQKYLDVELTNETIEEGYKILFEKDFYGKHEYIKNFYKLTGVKPSNGLLQ